MLKKYCPKINGLKNKEVSGFDFVIVHDAARPNVTEDDISNIYNEILSTKSDCSIFYMPMVDSLKEISKEKDITKDGIHIIIPEVVTKPNIQLFIRKKCLDLMKDIFENEIKSENSVEDIFDEAVINKNNWMMHGSMKPEREPYKITKVYKYKNGNENLKEIKEKKSLKDYVKMFSGSDKKKIIHEKISDRWEVCVTTSDNDTFEQVSFVNGIHTNLGGSHVDFMTKSFQNHGDIHTS